ATDGPRSAVRVRGGPGQGHLRPARGLHRGGRLKIHPAPHRHQRRGIDGPDPAVDRRGDPGIWGQVTTRNGPDAKPREGITWLTTDSTTAIIPYRKTLSVPP